MDIYHDEVLKLDNQVCFALYVCSKEIIKKYKPLLKPLGLTYTGYIAMLALWEKDNITVKDLGKRLYLDSGTLTPLLKKLESKGYVSRKRSDKDERTVNILLTDNGKKLKSKAVDIPHNLLCSIYHGNDFEIEDSSGLLKTLHSLIDTLGE
jgi:DNA-binding MarR family transcriptional regulator